MNILRIIIMEAFRMVANSLEKYRFCTSSLPSMLRGIQAKFAAKLMSRFS